MPFDLQIGSAVIVVKGDGFMMYINGRVLEIWLIGLLSLLFTERWCFLLLLVVQLR